MKKLLALVFLALSTSACGYSLAGRGSFLPDYIKIIGVPQFKNNTSTFNIDQILTNQVRQELLGRGGKYRVVPDSEGDAVLTGTIASIALQPVAFSAEQTATRYAVVVTASVEFRDTHTNKVIWQNPSVVFREEYDISSSTTVNGTDVNQFFGQNTNAMQRLAQSFARSVVTSILENF